MPSFVVHTVLPSLALLSTGLFRWQLVLLLLPVSHLPDLDFFVGVHRASLHNVFLPAALLGLAWRWRDDPVRQPWVEPLLIGFAYLASHAVMDLFVGGVVPFWPVLDTTFLIDVQVLVDTRTLETEAVLAPASHEGAPQVSPIYEFLSGTDVAVLFLAALVGLLALVRWLFESRPGTRVVLRQR